MPVMIQKTTLRLGATARDGRAVKRGTSARFSMLKSSFLVVPDRCVPTRLLSLLYPEALLPPNEGNDNAKGMDIYLINLDRRADRLAAMTAKRTGPGFA